VSSKKCRARYTRSKDLIPDGQFQHCMTSRLALPTLVARTSRRGCSCLVALGNRGAQRNCVGKWTWWLLMISRVYAYNVYCQRCLRRRRCYVLLDIRLSLVGPIGAIRFVDICFKRCFVQLQMAWTTTTTTLPRNGRRCRQGSIWGPK